MYCTDHLFPSGSEKKLVQEASLPFGTSEEIQERAGEILEEMPHDQCPYLTELATEYVAKPGYDYSDEFEFGLDLILDALNQMLRV